MANPSQTIMFTAMPRAIAVDPATLPVSVLVSPRLAGAPTLQSFHDWLNWTQLLSTKGLELTFAVGTKTFTTNIDTSLLQPALWKAIFDKDTRVDDYAFDDYTDRLVLSYPTRATLMLLKSIYQIGGLQLALPGGGDDNQRETRGKRRLLLELIDGLAVNWNADKGHGWRQSIRKLQQAELSQLGSSTPAASLNPFRMVPEASGPFTAGELGGDGLPNATRLPTPGASDGKAQDLRQALAVQFALYHHQPPLPVVPKVEFTPSDPATVIDFHKALTALQAYPALLRALGLVFDVDLPTDFLPTTSLTSHGSFGVKTATPGWTWGIKPTKTPLAQTAYDYLSVGGGHSIFLTAPRLGFTPPDPSGEVIGLLNLDARDFGLVQVDVDGAMHKTIIVAESVDNAAPPLHPEVFDPTSTLPSLRSAGLALVSDAHAIDVLKNFQNQKAFNDALTAGKSQPLLFFAEDLVRGFRIDVWDSASQKWHSLHRRDATYTIKKQSFTSNDEEGFTHLAVTSGALGSDPAQIGDFYLQEAIARWAGWSLSVPPVGKHLTRDPDPEKAVPTDDTTSPDFDLENAPATPFKMTTHFTVVKSSLPSLRFGRSYRVRARAVDIAGNSLKLDDPLTDALAGPFGTPKDPEGFAYLRYEPVVAPAVVLRTPEGLTSPGSAVDRLVIRSFNDDPSKDGMAADLTGSERHIVPPRASVELAERLGMFDDSAGKLRGDAALYDLIDQLNRPEQAFKTAAVPGQTQPMPIEPDAQIAVPYLPDWLAHGAALRDLPGTPDASLGSVDGTVSANPIAFPPVTDANPRPGSVTLVDFAGRADWTATKPFRLVVADGGGAPAWDASERTLTVSLPKGTTTIVPLSSYVSPGDLKLMGVWQWIREYFDALTRTLPISEDLWPGSDADALGHIIQRVTEGGHWMLTPPHLLTFVHAVQQPIGRPEFLQLDLQRRPGPFGNVQLESQDMSGPTQDVALDTITAWRKPNSIDAFLIGGLKVHGASTAKIDVLAAWEDPVDDGSTPPSRIQQSTHAEEIPLQDLGEGNLTTTGGRPVGYYNPAHDLICFVREGDILSATLNGVPIWENAAPRHHLNDTKHHRVTYTAVATSRFRDYFTPTQNPGDPNSPARDFTRSSEPVTVDIPASARPDAPRVLYVVPTFGWERQTSTNVKRSLRFGGGLRVYMDRPWYSSGDGELLGAVLYSGGGTIDREAWKPYVTQWGLDPIWDAHPLVALPEIQNFPLRSAGESDLSLQEHTPPGSGGAQGRVDVAGHEVQFDGKLWYADITVETFTDDYFPFVRLALARYQPHALDDAKLSKVVLADFAQIAPNRSLLVTADPYHPRRLRVTVSGAIPLGPAPGGYPDFPAMRNPPSKPTRVTVTVQQKDSTLGGDLSWRDAGSGLATITVDTDGQFASEKYLSLWSGTVEFAQVPQQGTLRLLIREFEFVSANWAVVHPGGEALPAWSEAPGRLVYAETIEIDQALIGPVA